MTRIAIDSDYLDFYDHAFYSPYNADIVWERRCSRGMSKRKQFAFLEQQGLKTPNHGTVAEVYQKIRKDYFLSKGLFHKSARNLAAVIVYLDEYAHRGLGKLRVSIELALDQYPNKYCSEFIQTTPSCDSVSYRYLQVGKKSFWLRYTGHDSWMSNHAEDVEVECLCANEDKFKFGVDCPVFAIDFIPGRALYAIDFNTAPGFKETGIPLKDPHEIYDLVEEWYHERSLATPGISTLRPALPKKEEVNA